MKLSSALFVVVSSVFALLLCSALVQAEDVKPSPLSSSDEILCDEIIADLELNQIEALQAGVIMPWLNRCYQQARVSYWLSRCRRLPADEQFDCCVSHLPASLCTSLFNP